MKILKNTDGSYVFRLDGAFTFSEYLTTPFIAEREGKEEKRYFGEFKFQNEDTVERQIETVVNTMLNENPNLSDTVFEGSYPKWIETVEYGKALRVSNKVQFIESIITKKEIPSAEISNNIYSLEVKIIPTKKNELFLVVSRAIKTSIRAGRETHDELFEDFFPDTSKDEDLPF